MSGKKGMKHYPKRIKAEIVAEYKKGESVHGLSRRYGISRYAIQAWCGLRKEHEQHIPKRRGRPRTKPREPMEDIIKENTQLKMEVELLRSFLQAAGRR